VDFAGVLEVKIDFVAAVFFAAAFLVAPFLRVGTAVFAAPCAFAASALFNAHRFFVAAMIARLPAAESFRFGFGDSGPV
jgi:hypothetical protein